MIEYLHNLLAGFVSTLTISTVQTAGGSSRAVCAEPWGTIDLSGLPLCGYETEADWRALISYCWPEASFFQIDGVAVHVSFVKWTAPRTAEVKAEVWAVQPSPEG